MAEFNLTWAPSGSSWISVEGAITEVQKLKLFDLLSTCVTEAWDNADLMEDSSVEETWIEKEEGNTIVLNEMEFTFKDKISGWYDPGRSYGPMEDCYPEDWDFEHDGIKFYEKKLSDLVNGKMGKDEDLKDLVIIDIDTEFCSLDDGDCTVEMEDNDEW